MSLTMYTVRGKMNVFDKSIDTNVKGVQLWAEYSVLHRNEAV